MKKRNVDIEFIRIIATLIVICLHTTSWYKKGNIIIADNLFIYSFTEDAVPLFWYITGMFLFRPGNTFAKNIRRTWKKTILPTLLFVFVVACIAPWLQGEASLSSCRSLSSLDIKKMLGSIARWSNSGLPLSGHLWFVFEYVKVILFFPLVRFVCTEDDTARKARHYLLALAIVAELIDDFQQFGILSIGKIQTFTILSPSLLYVVLGYELSLHLCWIDAHRKQSRMIGAACFVIANYARYFLALKLFAIDLENDHFLHIENVISIVSSMGLMLLLLTVRIRRQKLQSAVLMIASLSFPIYLLHRAVYAKMNACNVRNLFYRYADKGLVFTVLSVISYAFSVFIVTTVLAACIRLIKDIFCKCFNLNSANN